jgi:hypothetical protein
MLAASALETLLCLTPVFSGKAMAARIDLVPGPALNVPQFSVPQRKEGGPHGTTASDQLIPGIKGTLSVVELKVLKNRLVHGQEEKARRGELFRIVAPGYNAMGTESPKTRICGFSPRFSWCLPNIGNLERPANPHMVHP